MVNSHKPHPRRVTGFRKSINIFNIDRLPELPKPSRNVYEKQNFSSDVEERIKNSETILTGAVLINTLSGGVVYNGPVSDTREQRWQNRVYPNRRDFGNTLADVVKQAKEKRKNRVNREKIEEKKKSMLVDDIKDCYKRKLLI